LNVIVSGTVSKTEFQTFQEMVSDGDFKTCLETGSQEAFSEMVSESSFSMSVYSATFFLAFRQNLPLQSCYQVVTVM
jgi:hypothetical protein